MRCAFAALAGWLLATGAAHAATPLPQPPLSASADQDDADFDWLDEIDTVRLTSDADYARAIIAKLDAIQLVPDRPLGISDAADGIEALRIMALVGTTGPEGAAAFARQVVARQVDAPVARATAIMALTMAGEGGEAIDALEQSVSRIRDPEAAERFRDALNSELVNYLFRSAREEKRSADFTRLTLMLARMGWPGASDPRSTDSLRRNAASILLSKGEKAEAEAQAKAIVSPQLVAESLSLKAMDKLFSVDDREARLVSAMAAEDARSAAALAKAPDDVRLVRARVDFLRAADRSQEAFDVGARFVMDMEVLRAMFPYWGSDLLWLANEMAYVLVDLDRGDEADALLIGLETLDVEKHGSIVNMMINRLGVLDMLDRHEELAATAVSLANDDGAFQASPYGNMWIWAAAACAYQTLGRSAEAKPWADKVVAAAETNVSAHMQVLLCTGDDKGAEALMVKRLSSGDPEHAVMVLQDYRRGASDMKTDATDAALARLKASPAVQAAFDKVAHRIRMPMRQTYWGDF